jgi:hypothetical protein
MRYLRIVALSLVTFIYALPSLGQSSPSVDQKLPHGLRIPAVLDTSLSSEKSKVGDPVRLEVVADLHDKDGKVVLPRHSKLIGRVTYVARYEKNKQPAMLSFFVDRAEWKGHSGMLDAPVFGINLAVTDSQKAEAVEGIGMATLRHTDTLNLISRVRMDDFALIGNGPHVSHDNVLPGGVVMQFVLVPNPAIRTAFVKKDGDLKLDNDFLLVLLNGMTVVQ